MTVSVASCRFAHGDCSHRQLFQPTYQRANRSHGTKILRCFPHCCPQHVARSYCGSSLELRVPLRESQGEDGADDREMRVFARFRPSDCDQNRLRVGDRVALAKLTRSLQSDTNTKAEWIQARRRERDDTDRRERVYDINPLGRWYYDWQSGKRSAKRFTKHVLEAFVLVVDSSGSSTTPMLRVVAATQSSAFTIVSFRRVTQDPRDAVMGLATLDSVGMRMNLSMGPSDATTRPSVVHPIDAMPVRPMPTFMASRRPHVLPSSSSSSSLRRQSPSPSAASDAFDSDAQSTAEADASPSLRLSHGLDLDLAPAAFADQLRVVFSFVRSQPIDALKHLIPLWSRIAEDGMTLRRSPTPVDASVATLLGENAPSASHVAAHLVWWLALDRDIQDEWCRHVQRGAATLLNRNELQRHFSRFSQWLEGHVCRFLDLLGGLSLRRLVASLPPPLDHTSTPRGRSSSPFDWVHFVARARQAAALASPQHVLRPIAEVLALPKPLDSWLCPFHRISIAPGDANRATGGSQHDGLGHLVGQVPTSALFAFWQQLSSVTIDYDAQTTPPTLTIASARQENAVSTSHGTRLLLDNRYRWFNALPNGESTLVTGTGTGSEGQSFGDYVAVEHADGKIEVICFSWGSSDATTTHSQQSYQWRWQLRRQDLAGSRLSVRLSVMVGELTTSRLPERDIDSNWASWPIKAKLTVTGAWREQFRAQFNYERTSRWMGRGILTDIF